MLPVSLHGRKKKIMGLELFHLRVVKTDYTRKMKEESVPKKTSALFLFAVDFHLPVGVGQS